MFVRIGKLLKLNEFQINVLNRIAYENHVPYRICTKCGKVSEIESMVEYDGYNSTCTECLKADRFDISKQIYKGEYMQRMFDDYNTDFMESDYDQE